MPIAVTVGLVVTGCSSSSSSSSTTTSSVAATTSPTQAASSGASTPGAVTAAFLTAIETGNFTGFCVPAVPSQVAECKSATSEAAGKGQRFAQALAAATSSSSSNSSPFLAALVRQNRRWYASGL